MLKLLGGYETGGIRYWCIWNTRPKFKIEENVRDIGLGGFVKLCLLNDLARRYDSWGWIMWKIVKRMTSIDNLVVACMDRAGNMLLDEVSWHRRISVFNVEEGLIVAYCYHNTLSSSFFVFHNINLFFFLIFIDITKKIDFGIFCLNGFLLIYLFLLGLLYEMLRSAKTGDSKSTWKVCPFCKYCYLYDHSLPCPATYLKCGAKTKNSFG